jgi:hypothetical protein
MLGFSGCDCISGIKASSKSYWANLRTPVSTIIIDRVNWMDADILTSVLTAIHKSVLKKNTTNNTNNNSVISKKLPIFLVGDVHGIPPVPWSGFGRIMGDIWDSDSFENSMSLLPANVHSILDDNIDDTNDQKRYISHDLACEKQRRRMYDSLFYGSKVTWLGNSEEVVICESIPSSESEVSAIACCIALHPIFTTSDDGYTLDSPSNSNFELSDTIEKKKKCVHDKLFGSLANFLKLVPKGEHFSYQVMCSDDYAARMICDRYDMGRGFKESECGKVSIGSVGTKILIEDFPYMALITERLSIGGPTHEQAVAQTALMSTNRSMSSGWVRVQTQYKLEMDHTVCCGTTESDVLCIHYHSITHGFAISTRKCRIEPVDYVLLIVDSYTRREDLETAIYTCKKKLFICCETLEILETVKNKRRKIPNTNLSFLIRDKIKYA